MTAKTTDTSIANAASQLRQAILRTSRTLRQEGVGESSLSPTQLSALVSVYREGPLTPSELADIERVKRPTMTRTLACLEREGLIERTPDPADGRSSLVALNAAGQEALAVQRQRKSAYLARRLRKLDPDEVETLARAAELLERMREDERG